jgi:iron complex outermembrane receptor protein
MHISIPAARPRAIALAVRAAICLPCTTIAYAQGVATDQQLAPTVVVTGQIVRSGLANGVPSTSVSKTADDLREQNLVNPEDALKYVPNTTIRKRYIGDRNALIGGRSFGTLQPSRALVYVDGYLISNFLGRFDGPRWNMVTPEAIARVDVLYGPFSAIYPGNSIGTTVAVTEREPRRFEASARLTGYRQHFDQYGQSDHYNGHQESVFLGTRLESGLWATLGLEPPGFDLAADELLQRHGQRDHRPVRHRHAAHRSDRDAGHRHRLRPRPEGRQPGAVFGASGGAIDHTKQDTVKLKVGYAFTPELLAAGHGRVLDQPHRNPQRPLPEGRQRPHRLVRLRHRRRRTPSTSRPRPLRPPPGTRRTCTPA